MKLDESYSEVKRLYFEGRSVTDISQMTRKRLSYVCDVVEDIKGKFYENRALQAKLMEQNIFQLIEKEKWSGIKNNEIDFLIKQVASYCA